MSECRGACPRAQTTLGQVSLSAGLLSPSVTGQEYVSVRAGFCSGGSHEGCVKFCAREFGTGGKGYTYSGLLYAP